MRHTIWWKWYVYTAGPTHAHTRYGTEYHFFVCFVSLGFEQLLIDKNGDNICIRGKMLNLKHLFCFCLFFRFILNTITTSEIRKNDEFYVLCSLGIVACCLYYTIEFTCGLFWKMTEHTVICTIIIIRPSHLSSTMLHIRKRNSKHELPKFIAKIHTMFAMLKVIKIAK